MSEKYILIKESDLDSRIEELNESPLMNNSRITELQSLKQKGEVVETDDFHDLLVVISQFQSKMPHKEDLVSYIKDNYKLIKKV